MNRGAWRATVHRFTMSQTTEASYHAGVGICIYTYTHTHTYIYIYIYTYTYNASYIYDAVI